MEDIFGKLASDIKRYSTNVAKHTAMAVADELTQTAYDAIETFYADYEPEYYDRHYYNFEENSFRRFYHNNRDKIFSGGVELSTDNMEPDYKGTLDQVFTSVYMGFHGLPLADTPVMDTSPLEMIFTVREKIYNKPDKYIGIGESQAKKYKYSIL